MRFTEDRTRTYEIISQMLDNPDESGVYPTTEAFQSFDEYIKKVRIEAVGWMLTEACVMCEEGEDIREKHAPDILARALSELMPVL